ncbi:MAG: TolB family protein [Solirubrobacterales bacterium]
MPRAARLMWVPLLAAGLCLSAILAFAPGGSRAAFPGANGDVVFSRRTGPILVPKDPQPGGIFTVAPDGKDVTRITTGDDDDPAFSPNGKWIVFTRFQDKPGLYRVKADGSHLKRLSKGRGDDNAAFSPDGDKIVFSRGVVQPVKRGMLPNGSDIWVMRADGSHQHALTSNPAPDDFPSYSPNGKRIAFDSERGDNADIYVMRADGTGEHALSTGARDEHDPNYSPDGKQITYSKQTGEDYDVFSMDADGSHQRRLTTGSLFEGRSAYSPSGRKIVYVRDTRKEANLYVINADGSGEHAITEGTKVMHESPDWGPKP